MLKPMRLVEACLLWTPAEHRCFSMWVRRSLQSATMNGTGLHQGMSTENLRLCGGRMPLQFLTREPGGVCARAQMSKLWHQNEALAEALVAQGREGGAQRLAVKGAFATRRWTQFVALARKYRLSYWRSPSYNLTRLLLTLAICIFYGTMFLGRGRLPTDGAPWALRGSLCSHPWTLPAWHLRPAGHGPHAPACALRLLHSACQSCKG